MRKDNTVLSVLIRPDANNKIRKMAYDHGMSISELVRRLIDEYFDNGVGRLKKSIMEQQALENELTWAIDKFRERLCGLEKRVGKLRIVGWDGLDKKVEKDDDG